MLTGTRATTRLMFNRRKKYTGLIASFDSLPLLNLSFLSQSKQICVTVDHRLSNTQRHNCQHCKIWTLLTHTVTSSVEVRVCRRRLCGTDHRAPGCSCFGRTCAQKVVHWSHRCTGNLPALLWFYVAWRNLFLGLLQIAVSAVIFKCTFFIPVCKH